MLAWSCWRCSVVNLRLLCVSLFSSLIPSRICTVIFLMNNMPCFEFLSALPIFLFLFLFFEYIILRKNTTQEEGQEEE